MSRKLSPFLATVAATAVHALIFLATALYLIYFGKNDIAAVSWSLTFYYENASKVMAGMVPYRDFPFEYPILSFPLFLIPRLLFSDLGSYKVAFVVEMLAFDAAALYLIARFVRDREGLARVPGSLGWYTLFCAILSPLVIGRFELAPMVLAFAATCWWFSGKSALGGVTAGLGTLMKIFPGVVAALALLWEVKQLMRPPSPPGGEGGRRPGEGADGAVRESPDPAPGSTARFLPRAQSAPPTLTRARGTAAFIATLATGMAIWFALGGRRVLESLGYHAERGLEVESLYGGALFLWGTLAGTDAPWVFNYKAFHVAPEWGARLAPLVLPIQAATILLVMARFWRSGMTEGMRYSASAVLAFIVTGKVLSPQYLIWLFPFMTVIDGPTGRLARQIFLLGCLTTALLYPGPGFIMVLDHQPGAILILNLRNILLVWLLVLLLFGPRES
jgi:Glycosyltransferase family 87